LSLSLDGHNNATGSSVNSVPITLTTVNSSDVVVIFIGTFNIASLTTVASVSDTSSLSWQKRPGAGRYDFQLSLFHFYYDLEIWYATASSALNNDSITVNLSQAASTTDVIAFGVSGANFASPFDPNVGLPVFAANNSGGAVGSTTNPNTMVIGLYWRLSALGPVLNPGTGFSLIDQIGQGYSAEYQIAYSAQTNLKASFSVTNDAVCAFDAITAPAYSGAAFPNLKTYPKKMNILD